MYLKILSLIGMFYLHVADDYYLQGRLASTKQREWWRKNAPDKMYSHDFLAALFIHAFSWTCAIMTIPSIYCYFHPINMHTYLSLFILNVCAHAAVDNLKANVKSINLIQDQTVHVIQIVFTWAVFIVFR